MCALVCGKTVEPLEKSSRVILRCQTVISLRVGNKHKIQAAACGWAPPLAEGDGDRGGHGDQRGDQHSSPHPGRRCRGTGVRGGGEGGGDFGPLGPLGVRHAGGANGRRAQCAPPREPFKIRLETTNYSTLGGETLSSCCRLHPIGGLGASNFFRNTTLKKSTIFLAILYYSMNVIGTGHSVPSHC